jgi:outer membrane protein OmpA-like peptidoglycan-associated protein
VYLWSISDVRSYWRRVSCACSLTALIVSSLLPRLAFAEQTSELASEDTSQWFLGGYYRHVWVPSLILSPLFERAPGISNNGFGITASHSSRGGVTAEIGVGYMPYRFNGAFNDQGAVIEDTEYVTSKLALMHITGSLLWPIELHRMLTLEIGLGVDLGIIIGSLHRTEAYADAQGIFHPCQSALHPMTTGPDSDAQGAAIPYCDQAIDKHGNPAASSPADVSGAHYNAKETRVPPVMLVPMLPHLALRFAPFDRVAIKVEAAFGLAQFWVGASVLVGLGHSHRETPAAPAIAEAEIAPMRSLGRVLGKLMEQSTNVPIARASLKTKRVFSAIQSDDAGLFVFDKLEPGPVHLEINHPAYEAGSCDVTIPAQGGDAMVHCFLRPLHKPGAISGQVKDQQGRPVANAQIDITGPVAQAVLSNSDGLFALLDAAQGTYRLSVTAQGFQSQLVEIEVGLGETSTPQIILLQKPEAGLVRREGNALELEQQIGFTSDRAEIAQASDGLLRAIADLLLRSPEVTLIEIQGHTDNRGGRDHNQALSQARADAVRAWLVAHGVAAERLQTRGYGQDRPLYPNDTVEQRAKNRRVQFIITQTMP